MKKNLLVWVFMAVLLVNCSDKEKAVDPEKPEVKKEEDGYLKISLINGSTSSKSWNITKSSLDNDFPSESSCRTSNIKNKDNRWIFKSGGLFEYDNGKIQEDKTCESNCCADLAKLKGKWTIKHVKSNVPAGKFDIGDSLLININQRKRDNEAEFVTIKEFVIKGKITAFSDKKIVLEKTNPKDKKSYTDEYTPVN